MRSLIEREPATCLETRLTVEVGDEAPDFDFPGGGAMHRLSDFRGSPVVLAFHGTQWDPARAEHIETYNRLISSLGGVAGMRLLQIGGAGPWRDLSFTDAALSLPVLAADSAVAERYGVGREPAVFVIDASGIVRWSQVGPISLASPTDVARAISIVAAPFADASVEPGAPNDEERPGWTRRDFVATALAAAFALALRPVEAQAERVAAYAPSSIRSARLVTLNVNGRALSLSLEPRVTLLDALREYAGLTGSKKGCDHGQCGACTVHIDGRRELSCLTFAVMQEGRRITTIEGLANGDQLHPMQQAFITNDGFQCGYCTSGQIMSAVAVVDEPWGPTDDEVREAMSGNICRCGAYPGIVAAVQEVRRAQASNGGGNRQ
ncbi:MAG TPA: 2Fe-2S iron-sulfur cluster-binding protein [Gemmatimonadaceae bacterium]|nr:2Fe-2S iron-sulfur cluster-binding protein [Gemmatimonadaceae bacterium]